MGYIRPSLVVDSTNTDGTGSYTLLGADPGDGFRTLADAVADGDAANSDTISYFVVDTTTKGATLEWEHGTGTISDSGATLARTSIIESSNGGAAVNWGVGGTRTVRFGAGTAGFALLAAANTWTAAQTFSEGMTSSKAVAGGLFDSLVGTNSASANSANIVATVQKLKDSAGTLVNATSMSTNLSTTTAGADTTRVRFFVRTAGAGTVAWQVQGGVLQDGSGTAYALTSAVSGVLNAPSGFRMLAGTSTIPAGWAVASGVSDRTVMLTSTGSEAGTTGGSWTTGISASTTVNGHTLTEAEMPVHSHGSTELGFITSDATGSFELTTAAGSDTSNILTTATAGGGGSHSHTASTSINSNSYRPAYERWVRIQKS